MECKELCGNCSNGDPCHHVDGTCTNGCDTGIYGDKCDKGNAIIKFFQQRLELTILFVTCPVFKCLLSFLLFFLKA